MERGVDVNRRMRAVWPALVFGLAVPGAPPATAVVAIRPGDYVVMGARFCTLNFVYDGAGALAGRVYVGTAAGCAGYVGRDASLDDGTHFGDVAFIGDVAVAAKDFALVEVRTAYQSSVSAVVGGCLAWPPTGVASPAETRAGDRVCIVGQGFGTARKRDGVLLSDESGAQQTYGPISPGDAGAPLVHVATGKALGIVSRPGYCPGPRDEPCPLPTGPAPLSSGAAPCPPTECVPVWEGPTIQGVLSQAAAAGFTVTLRTA